MQIKSIHLIENLDDSYGGPAKSVPYLCKYLEDIGVPTVMLSVRHHDNEENEVIKKNDLKWRSFAYRFIKKLRYSPSLNIYFQNLSLSEKKVVLHTHNLWNYISYLAYSLSRKNDIPLIVAVRGSLYPWSLKQNKIQKIIAWKLFQKKFLNNATCIHATDIEEIKSIRDLGITSPMALVPNGVDLQEFESMNDKLTAKSKLNLEQSKKYVLFLSRIHPKKGLEFLTKSWASIADSRPNWDLLIVGPVYDERYFNDINELVVKYNLTDRICFKGMLTGIDRVNAFAASDIFVLPSYTENFGISIAEAMAAKLPVITTHGTPWREIKDNNAGWWVELNQKNINDALAEALSCSDEDLKQRGLNGFKLIKKYEWKIQAQKMKQLYEYVLSERKKPGFVYEFNKKN
jgi:glycosyltransferase involved in cell wall biosynthesis